jgi:hypothetical protein
MVVGQRYARSPEYMDGIFQQLVMPGIRGVLRER